MRRIIMLLVAHASYWYGDAVSRLFSLVPDKWEWLGGWLYDRYSSAMLLSFELDERYGFGLWTWENEQ